MFCGGVLMAGLGQYNAFPWRAPHFGNLKNGAHRGISGRGS